MIFTCTETSRYADSINSIFKFLNHYRVSVRKYLLDLVIKLFKSTLIIKVK